MKKLIKVIIVCLFVVLSSCSSEDEISEIDKSENTYLLDADYSILHSNMAWLRNMDMTEDYIVLFPYVSIGGLIPQSGEMPDGTVISYLHNDEAEVLDSDPSSSCSIQNLKECDGFVSGNNFNVYKDKIYYIASVYDHASDSETQYISRCDFDGRNQEKLFKVPLQENEKTTTGGYNLFELHRNKIYFMNGEQFYIGDVDTLDFNDVQFDGVKGIVDIFFDDSTTYISAEQYEKDDKVHFDVTLECDLSLNVKKIIEEDKNLIFIDKDMMFYTEDMKTYLLNRNTKKISKIGDTIFNTIFYHDGYYLLDNSVYYDETPMIILMDKNGEIIYTKDLRNKEMFFHRPQIFTGDRLYVSNGRNKFGYFPIKDNEIGDYIELVNIEGEE